MSVEKISYHKMKSRRFLFLKLHLTYHNVGSFHSHGKRATRIEGRLLGHKGCRSHKRGKEDSKEGLHMVVVIDWTTMKKK
jgi:hypothetical protein